MAARGKLRRPVNEPYEQVNRRDSGNSVRVPCTGSKKISGAGWIFPGCALRGFFWWRRSVPGNPHGTYPAPAAGEYRAGPRLRQRIQLHLSCQALRGQNIALDLWTSADFLERKFSAHGLSDRITPVQMDATQPLPFTPDYFDSVFCMNSFSFYGGNLEFIEHLLKHLKPGGQLCVGSEALTSEFSAEQLTNPPPAYAFRLPPPNEHVDVFEDDFRKQHTLHWWRTLFESSAMLQVEHCQELEDADAIYEELVRYEHEKNIDPFDVQICLDQMEWGRANEPRKTLFVITACKG